MPEHLQPSDPNALHAALSDTEDDRQQLRILSRSPHPYHRQSSDLLDPSDRLVYGTIPNGAAASSHSFPKDSTPVSESGTEADDEHFLKGLPAPKARLHKGLRGVNEALSGSSTPLLSPAILEDEGRKTSLDLNHGQTLREKRSAAERSRRRKEIIRRSGEVLLLACQGGLVASNRGAQPFLQAYRRELVLLASIVAILVILYPLRLVMWAYRRRNPSKLIPIRVPISFDPAPLLYPPIVPVLVSLLVARGVDGAVPLNVVLGICSLPKALIPGAQHFELYDSLHWLLSCIPATLGASEPRDIAPETLTLLYPLHQTLCLILQSLTTTSLLVAELQLLSITLINLLLVAHSPQTVILRALLWIGGLSLIVFCSQVILWGADQRLSFSGSGRPAELDESIDGNPSGQPPGANYQRETGLDEHSDGMPPLSPVGTNDIRISFNDASPQASPRRHTLPTSIKSTGVSKTTPSGRRKRSASYSIRAFFSLTQSQAAKRRWLYAGYVYFVILLTILVLIRSHVQQYALSSHEPIGWALGYLFGDTNWFRFHVVSANLERWICLPPRGLTEKCCASGWVQHLRSSSIGEANTRLVLSAYWLGIITFGLAVVFQLSPIYEVDTRRKVFHFMMVAMFCPTIFIDPGYISLALSLVLGIFLLLDLLRASQLPPLSKPIAAFLTPYVDGRDLRGPVVISHIFLLIGCAIPLWLSMAALPRSGEGALSGWEVVGRDVSMISGVVCVGLGDAAASLIGRRWGRRKWLWGGGKSIEGSVAFATAVFGGLMAGSLWLRIGGWESEVGYTGIGSIVEELKNWLWGSASMQKTALCASVASLTEAVLTGGNDNVVVPVVLWVCVKGIGI
ncbi:hypothetical protein OQA88_4673 [Cercophora sp. LCS_1]